MFCLLRVVLPSPPESFHARRRVCRQPGHNNARTRGGPLPGHRTDRALRSPGPFQPWSAANLIAGWDAAAV